MKKFLLFALAVLFIIPLSGCVTSKRFKKDDFSITLTNEFEEGNQNKVTYYFQSNIAGVAVLKENFEYLKISKLDRDSTLEDYKDVIVKYNYNDVEVKKEKNFYYFTYVSTRNNVTYYYFSAMYKGSDAFWLINFFTLKDNAKKLEHDFLKFAKSVEVQ